MLLAPHVRNSPSRALCHALDRYRKSNVCLHDDKICFGILIHAPRMGRDDDVAEVNPILRISIHAPRMGRDVRGGAGRERGEISIHAPRMGRDSLSAALPCPCCHFNPRAPYGARLVLRLAVEPIHDFNPRAPYGARHVPRWRDIRTLTFQSTRPMRGATTIFA